jgi:hypothetical protein
MDGLPAASSSALSLHLRSSPLAGLGGEGREGKVSMRSGGRGGGGFSAPVLVRGTEWRPSSSSSTALLLMACRGGEEKEESLRRQEADSLFKRGCSSVAGAASVLVSLAGRGCKEEDMNGSAAPAKDLHLRETLENSLPVAISKRQISAVAAIPGQMGGLATLVAVICASTFFLFVLQLRLGNKAPHTTKWSRPWLRLGWRRLIAALCRRALRIQLRFHNLH